VRKAEVVPDVKFAIRQPGKIWSLDRFSRPTVVCGEGMLKLVQVERDGASALPIRTLRQRFR
jgi:methionyl-tRNA formyltransferase